MQENLISKIRLQLPAGSANASPPVGPVLGQYGINILNFCNSFNNLTSCYEKGVKINVDIKIFKNKTFFLQICGPSTIFLIKNIINLNKGSSNPNKCFVGNISLDQIYSIAKVKISNFNTDNLDSIVKSIIGTIKSMGVVING